MNQEELRKKLQKIVESIETIEPVADFDSDQWKKGNASLKLIGKSISSLNVNIKKNEYGVGIDGNNKGDILDFLKSNFKFNNENDQNERYKVKPEKIEEVVRYYAGVKQENMEKVLFCRITSMEYYQDIDGDTQEGGGSYTKDNLAHERFNFKIRDGIFKGFVQSSSKTGGMNLKKIDPIVNEDADSVNGVLVIFVADNNIVGYYKDATVYGSIQNNDNYDQGRYDAYNIKTQSKAVLLSPDSRDYEIPRGSGAMGQANTFYLYDDNGNEKQGKWIQEAVNYVKINQLVKSYIPQIIDYLNNNPNQIDELTSDNFGTTSYPLIKTIKEIEENDKGVEDNKTLHYRYWTETYTINNKKHRFHSQWGGHKVWNGEESSISSDEKHRNSFIDYLKEQGIYSLTLTPNIWKMSHGSDTESFRNEWLHDNKISLHTNTKSKGKSEYTQADNFKNNVKIGDVVLLSHGSNIKRLVEVVSEILNPDDMDL
ncbi:MAG: hypothetical protein Ctma_0693 [Catillopecten margaritatus gill symbiont]|uniref:Uncharacterized protein n=1 Tax=Catillopecten margaritatus gill symbiont TaxID=3083288 RepID=A0AAU6PG40_9GAMM